jgi:hypothetical protein
MRSAVGVLGAKEMVQGRGLGVGGTSVEVGRKQKWHAKLPGAANVSKVNGGRNIRVDFLETIIISCRTL